MKNSAFAIAALASACLLAALQYAPEQQLTTEVSRESAVVAPIPAQSVAPVTAAASSPSLDEESLEAARSRMTGAVRALADAGGTEIVDLVVAYMGSNFEAEAARIEALGGYITGRYDALSMMNIRIPAARLYAMAASETLRVANLNNKV